MNLQRFATRRNITIAVAAFVVLVLFVTSITISSNNSNKSTRQPVGEELSTSYPAVISKGEDLYAAIGAVRYEQLRNDLTAYAREVEKSTDKEVAYEINSKITTKGETVTFSCKYNGSPNHKIDVSIQKLNNDRQKLTFISSKTKSNNFDAKLSSNSARNTFIASLPVTADLYSIDYDAKSETIVVSLGEHSLVARNTADAALKSALGEDIKTGVSYLVPGLGNSN